MIILDKKELYKIWAPTEATKWTQFAKPALFANANEFILDRNIQIPLIPPALTTMKNRTLIIVDLPGAVSVTTGLGLAKEGFRPVPLYNSIHEKDIGELSSIVKNQPIVDALVAGADILRYLKIDNEANPVFLLDYDRNNDNAGGMGDYDNRWRVDFEDLPQSQYLMSNNINNVILWTEGEIHNDIKPIIDSYCVAGITVSTYRNGQFETFTNDWKASLKDSVMDVVRKFENARFCLRLIMIMACINLFFQWSAMEQPLLWTAPSIPWMTYLWFPYGLADFISILVPVIYLLLYFMSKTNHKLMNLALLFFGLDVTLLYMYAFVLYEGGVVAYSGNLIYGLIVLGGPVALLVYLAKGVGVLSAVDEISPYDYSLYLEELYETTGMTRYYRSNYAGPVGIRRARRYERGLSHDDSNYRGYRGYGGAGRGGYRGRGYGGSYSGGFGG